LENISIFSVNNCLKILKDKLIPLLELMDIKEDIINKINNQWANITSIQWLEKNNTHKFWYEVSLYRDASGDNPFADLSSFAIQMLVLPWSNAEGFYEGLADRNLCISKIYLTINSKLGNNDERYLSYIR